MTDEGWTLGTLKTHLSEKITSHEDFAEQRHNDTEKAREAALASMNKRLESMNEFRLAISDQRLLDEKSRTIIQETFLTKEIYGLEQRNLETLVNKNSDRIIEMDKKLFALSELKVDKREGLNSKHIYSVILFSAVSVVISLVGIFLHH